MLGPMDAKEALADLAEISAQILEATLLDSTGERASTIADATGAASFAAGVRALLAEADRQAASLGQGELEGLEVSTASGSVFVVRGREQVIAATARPGAIAGLVVYDLKRCLERLEADTGDGATAPKSPARKRAPRQPADGAPAGEAESDA